MNTDTPELVLKWSEGPAPYRGGNTEDPVWSHVEERIERAFRSGGSVVLTSAERVFEPREAVRAVEAIDMTSEPGRFRLVLKPKAVPGVRKSNLREWWEPGDTPFRGMEIIQDDSWDSRTVCTDPNIAKSLLKDFFDSRGITDRLLSQTRSVWDSKPRA